MDHRGVHAFVASGTPALTERHPARPPLGRCALPDRRGAAGGRRPRRDAPTAQVYVPTPTPRRRPTRPYCPEGTSTTDADLAYRARRAHLHRTPRPGLPRPEGISTSDASTFAYC